MDLIVADTNVIVRGMRSSVSASGLILRGMVDGSIPFAITPAVFAEYEEVLKRDDAWSGRKPSDELIEGLLNVLAANGHETLPWFRFRPFLADPDDDIFIECALTSGARLVVTDDRHFRHPAVVGFGLTALSPGDFVAHLRSERSI